MNGEDFWISQELSVTGRTEELLRPDFPCDIPILSQI